MTPPYLQKGDTIGIVCPAGYMAKEKTDTCVSTLIKWGYKVKVGKTVGSQFHYFSGTDDERREDLQSMLDDVEVKAILCGRGGYGTSRIIDDLDWKQFKKHPKWIIGYSDITVLHGYVYTKLKTVSIHAPMSAAFNNDGFKSSFVQSLKKILAGQMNTYKTPHHALNIPGNVEGLLVGGNLSILAHQIGTASDINTKDKILFIEDIGEYLYNIDRMLVQLDRNGKLAGLKALVVGAFTDMKDTTVPFGQTAEEIILERVKQYNYPVCFNFPVGHQDENYALKVGGTYQLTIGKTTSLREILPA